MTLLIVIVLVCAWTWWGYVTWRDRRATAGRGATSIASFNNHLSVLERSRPGVAQGVRMVPAQQSTVTVLRGAPSAATASASGDTSGSQAQRLRALHSPQSAGAHSLGRSGPSMAGGSLIGSPLGTRQAATMSLAEAQQRRRRAVTSLGAGVLVTVPLALLAGGVFVPLAVVVVAAAAAYGLLLVRARRMQMERVTKVRPLDRAVRPVQVVAPAYGHEDQSPMPTADAFGSYGDDHYGMDRYLAESDLYAGTAN